MSSKFSPVKGTERILILDVLRGLAIFGILMVNMPLMYEPMTQLLIGADPEASVSQIISESFIKIFFEGKFYVIFSMLFGFGFFIFMNKKNEDGSGIITVFIRRLFVLLLFGAAHLLLLWPGDILIFYALFGIILLLFRKSSDKKVFRWAVSLAIVPFILISLFVLLITLASHDPEIKTMMDANMQKGVEELRLLAENASQTYSTGTFTEMISMRLQEYQALLPAIAFFYPVVMAMFLFGFLAARKGIIHNYKDHIPFFTRLLWWGLGIGIVTSALYAVSFRNAVTTVPNEWSMLSSITHAAGGIFLGFFYISAVVLLFNSGKAEFLKNFIAPVGKMALTNYLAHSFICALLFYSYGFGLFGRVEVWQGIILTIIIYGLQILFSRWWLDRFLFGPLEWFWRSLTYLKLQPIKKMNNNTTIDK
jgi:uncharacterized protein